MAYHTRQNLQHNLLLKSVDVAAGDCGERRRISACNCPAPGRVGSTLNAFAVSRPVSSCATRKTSGFNILTTSSETHKRRKEGGS